MMKTTAAYQRFRRHHADAHRTFETAHLIGKTVCATCGTFTGEIRQHKIHGRLYRWSQPAAGLDGSVMFRRRSNGPRVAADLGVSMVLLNFPRSIPLEDSPWFTTHEQELTRSWCPHHGTADVPWEDLQSLQPSKGQKFAVLPIHHRRASTDVN